VSQTSQDLENRTKYTAVQTRYNADALFVHVFLALIYAVPLPSCQSEPNGSTCSHSVYSWQRGSAPKKMPHAFSQLQTPNFISNLSPVTCFYFVSHLQAEYIIVVGTTDYNAISGFDETSTYIKMEYYNNIH
jgi:hypothetical protein